MCWLPSSLIQVAKGIGKNMFALGECTVSLVQASADVKANPEDVAARKDLSDNAKYILEKVAQVLSSLQAGAMGAQACNEAIATIAGIVGDLETTAMFAAAGALSPEGRPGTFAEQR